MRTHFALPVGQVGDQGGEHVGLVACELLEILAEAEDAVAGLGVSEDDAAGFSQGLKDPILGGTGEGDGHLEDLSVERVRARRDNTLRGLGL